MGKLTATKVKNAKCPKDKKVNKIADGSGLYLWVYPNNSKTWAFTKTHKGKTYSKYESFDSLTLAEAREWALELSKKVARGEPLDEEKSNCPAFKEVFEDWYNLWSSSGKVTERYAKQVYNAINKNFVPSLGNKPIDTIGIKDIHTGVQLFIDRGSYEYLRRSMYGMKAIFKYAKSQLGLIAHNIVEDVDLSTIQINNDNHVRALEPHELPILIEGIENGRQQQKIEQTTYRLIYWILLTMTRVSESCQATWHEIDWDNRLWVIPWERMKDKKSKTNHRVYLTDFMLEILKAQKETNRGSDYIFEGAKKGKPIHSETPLKTFNRLNINTTAHGLRTLARTCLEETGKYSFEDLERCLAHTVGNKASRAYVRTDNLEQRRKIYEDWSETIKDLRTTILGRVKDAL